MVLVHQSFMYCVTFVAAAAAADNLARWLARPLGLPVIVGKTYAKRHILVK
jgi:uncharacterized protein (DUF2062 family)